MTDRGRDLKVAILSDVTKFDAAKPADQLDKLANAADRADRALDRMNVQDDVRDVDKLGDTARDTARKVDDAFDAIARASRQGTQKLGDNVNTAKRKLSEVADEAKDTAREALASFSSLGGDLADAGQEIAANAGALFGPVGLAIGGALSAGIAIFSQNAQQLKEMTNSMIQELLETGGKVTAELVAKRLQAMGDKINETSALAAKAKINIEDYNLALVADPDAIRRVTQEVDARIEALSHMADVNALVGENYQALLDEQRALEAVSSSLGLNAAATKRAEDAMVRMTGAQSVNAASTKAQETALAAVMAQYRAAERTLSDPIVVDIDTSAAMRKLSTLRAAAKYAAMDISQRYMP